MKTIKKVSLLLLLAFCVLFVSCNFSDDLPKRNPDSLQGEVEASGKGDNIADEEIITKTETVVICYYDFPLDRKIKETCEIEVAGELTYKDVIDLLSAKYGMKIGYHSAVFEDRALRVDFDTNFAPYSGTGSTGEGMILDSLAHTLLINFETIDEIYYSADSAAYSSGHIILSYSEPYLTREIFENPKEHNISVYEEVENQL